MLLPKDLKIRAIIEQVGLLGIMLGFYKYFVLLLLFYSAYTLYMYYSIVCMLIFERPLNHLILSHLILRKPTVRHTANIGVHPENPLTFDPHRQTIILPPTPPSPISHFTDLCEAL